MHNEMVPEALHSADLNSAGQSEKNGDKYSRIFHSRIFQLLPDAVCLARVSDGIFLEVNQAFEQLTGYQSAEMVDRTAAQLGLWTDPGLGHRVWQEWEETERCKV